MVKIFMLLIFVTSHAVQAKNLEFSNYNMKCGPVEVFNDCPSYCYESCPTRDGEFGDCNRPTVEHCPPQKCVCQFNYRRALNGTCIPARFCPAFECSMPNEVYDPCPVYCPIDDCSEATPNGECPHHGLLLVQECIPACRCKPTFWRKIGICVPYEKCDKKNLVVIPLTSS